MRGISFDVRHFDDIPVLDVQVDYDYLTSFVKRTLLLFFSELVGGVASMEPSSAALTFTGGAEDILLLMSSL